LSVDRIGRSLQRLVALLSDLQAKDIDLYLHQQGIDTTTPAGKAMFQMCGVFAEFERAMIRKQVKAGLERARAQGKTLGRPRTPEFVEIKIRAERRKGKGIKKIASSSVSASAPCSGWYMNQRLEPGVTGRSTADRRASGHRRQGTMAFALRLLLFTRILIRPEARHHSCVGTHSLAAEK
jgi:DNA invertase Pin-like site-specific DNA recombinase